MHALIIVKDARRLRGFVGLNYLNHRHMFEMFVASYQRQFFGLRTRVDHSIYGVRFMFVFYVCCLED